VYGLGWSCHVYFRFLITKSRPQAKRQKRAKAAINAMRYFLNRLPYFFTTKKQSAANIPTITRAVDVLIFGGKRAFVLALF
jgi:hypothetical protein